MEPLVKNWLTEKGVREEADRAVWIAKYGVEVCISFSCKLVC
jgi:hypothetical protein